MMKSLELRRVLPAFYHLYAPESEVWDREVTFAKEGTFLIGPSGRGKSSLMHFIYGLNEHYSGEIYWNQKLLKGMCAEEVAGMRKNSVSIVFQDLRLFSKATLFDNIDVKRVLNARYDSIAIHKMASTLQIEHKLNSIAGECSYGEQQRAAIIRALMQPFDFLLLDEPFSHLDEANKVAAWKLISTECTQRGAGFIFAGLDREEYMQNYRIVQL